MTDQKVMIVFGLPGVGKSTLIQETLKKRNDFVRLSGGSLINKELSENERDILRKQNKNQILSNQDILVLNFQKRRQELAKKHIIFDGHCVIKSGDTITNIPPDIIECLKPDIIIIIDEPSEVIIERRNLDSSRPGREVETISDINSNRDLQLDICRNYSTELNIPLKVLTSPNLDQINAILSRLIDD